MTPTQTRGYTVYKKGYAAHRLGASLMMNPYDWRTERYLGRQWQAGYAAAMDDASLRTPLPLYEVEDVEPEEILL